MASKSDAGTAATRIQAQARGKAARRVHGAAPPPGYYAFTLQHRDFNIAASDADTEGGDHESGKMIFAVELEQERDDWVSMLAEALQRHDRTASSSGSSSNPPLEKEGTVKMKLKGEWVKRWIVLSSSPSPTLRLFREAFELFGDGRKEDGTVALGSWRVDTVVPTRGPSEYRADPSDSTLKKSMEMFLGTGLESYQSGSIPRVCQVPPQWKKDCARAAPGWVDGALPPRARAPEATAAAARDLCFDLNGHRVVLKASQVDPRVSLGEWIRSRTTFTGTKLSCGQGGCGVCTVVVARQTKGMAEPQWRSVPSCLVPLASLDGCAVTTTEGLGASRTGYHPVQRRVASFNASQCGFCTPGMVMSIWGRLKEKCGKSGQQGRQLPPRVEAQGRAKAVNGDSQLLEADVPHVLDGNLCRCTGYRPLLDACRSFAADADPDVSRQHSYAEDAAGQRTMAAYDAAVHDRPFPDWLVGWERPSGGGATTFEGGPSVRWTRCSTVADATSALTAALAETRSVEVVAGNTAVSWHGAAWTRARGEKKGHQHEIVDISAVDELAAVKVVVAGTGAAHLRVGAAATITNLIEALQAACASAADIRGAGAGAAGAKALKDGGGGLLHAEGTFAALAGHLVKVAGRHVRNVGTVVGNIMMTKHLGFSGDIGPILSAVGTTLELTAMVAPGQWEEHTVPLLAFVRGDQDVLPKAITALPKEAVLVRALLIPTAAPGEVLRTFRVATAGRPQNSGPKINAGFRATATTTADKDGGLTLSSVCLVLGGGWLPPRVFEAADTARFLESARLSSPDEAAATLAKELRARAGVKKEHAIRLYCGALKHWLSDLLAAGNAEATGDAAPAAGPGPFSLPRHLASGNVQEMGRSPLSAKEKKEKDAAAAKGGWFGSSFSSKPDDRTPLHKAIPKITAPKQAAGELVYAGDQLAASRDLAHARFLTSPIARGRVELSAALVEEILACDGVLALLDARDITGKNDVAWSESSWVEPLFACPPPDASGDNVFYHGQNLALVVAESRAACDAAVSMAIRKLAVTPSRAVVTVLDAEEQQSFFDTSGVPFWNKHIAHHSKGDATTKIAAAARDAGDNTVVLGGVVSTPKTHHFYMERQTSVAVVAPDEFGGNGKDGGADGVKLYSAQQWPWGLVVGVANVLGITQNNVHSVQHSAGGSFGGKLTRNTAVAAAASLAAIALRRAVRLELSIEDDLKQVAGQMEMRARYDVVVDKRTGKVNALNVDLDLLAGWYPDWAGFAASEATHAMGQVYDLPNMSINTRLCRTNRAPHTVQRAPGNASTTAIMEGILAKVAQACGLHHTAVQEANMKGSKACPPLVREIWGKLKADAKYEERAKAVAAFNAAPQNVRRHRVRGIAMAPSKYAILCVHAEAQVSVHFSGGANPLDGSVTVQVSGTEIGQGLFTKVAQTVAYELGKVGVKGGVPLSMIRVLPSDSLTLPNGGMTASSSTSELCCLAAREASQELVSRLKGVVAGFVRAAFGPEGLSSKKRCEMTWPELISTVGLPLSPACSLTAHKSVSAFNNMNLLTKLGVKYFCYGAAITEIELDVLTGETVVRRVDLLYDAARSLNPAIDLGQVQGAFVQQIGFLLREAMPFVRLRKLGDEKAAAEDKTLVRVHAVVPPTEDVGRAAGRWNAAQLAAVFESPRLEDRRTGPGSFLAAGEMVSIVAWSEKKDWARLQNGLWVHGSALDGSSSTAEALPERYGRTANLVDSTWKYKPPCAMDVPEIFNVNFLNRSFPRGIYGSKATGEPPVLLANSVLAAAQMAVRAAKQRSRGEKMDEAAPLASCKLDVPLLAEDLVRECEG